MAGQYAQVVRLNCHLRMNLLSHFHCLFLIEVRLSQRHASNLAECLYDRVVKVAQSCVVVREMQIILKHSALLHRSALEFACQKSDHGRWDHHHKP